MWIVALFGCTEVVGDLYGGGSGLTLSFEDGAGTTTDLAWEGAGKGELRKVNGDFFDQGETWDPVAYVAEQDGWAIRVDDTFNTTEHLQAVGLECFLSSDYFVGFVNSDRFGFSVGMNDPEGIYYIQVLGQIPEDATADMLEGDVTATAEWSGDFAACGADVSDMPPTISASWSFDEKVKVPLKCVGCGSEDGPFDDLFDFNITF